MPSPPVPPSRRRLVRVRRLLWRWRHALLAVGLVSAVGVVVQEVRPPAPPTVAVVVLARDVPAGTPLAESDVHTVRLPREVTAARMLRAPVEAVGQRLAVGLPAGFPLAAEVLVGPGLATGTAPGEVVVPVRLADAAVARTLRPGDRVDLLAATADAAASEGGAEVVAAGALVVALEEDGGGGLLGGEEPTSLVFVAVPRGAAPDVVGASAWAPLRVVLPG
ncbi:SAF domain-containing protein [Georgenia satyanarayanai]|uniref:SAF domain-containing protein n=1 Tax=Georgenia satyanarayanai TaxID=860221 RepID=UPI00203C449E|nr:SAF domain-containing protein [Georgenia satyanarayanai]MCM3662240.1 SAF domain-containing protein [Georgenia satyanarayanai]